VVWVNSIWYNYKYLHKFHCIRHRQKLRLSQFIEYLWGSFHIPAQFTPSPVKPLLHAQVNDPCVLLHVALSWQLCVLMAHSFTSATVKRELITLSQFVKLKPIDCSMAYNHSGNMVNIFPLALEMLYLNTLKIGAHPLWTILGDNTHQFWMFLDTLWSNTFSKRRPRLTLMKQHH
jgi:hypothetical protein